MNKYKKLISNTILFGIGTFSSKVLVILLMPLYTRVLTTTEYGITDNLVQAANLILPLVTVGILNGIIRFGLDRDCNKSDVFTVGLLTTAAGFSGFLLLSPLMSGISFITGYTPLVYLYALASVLRSLCSQFVRVQERVRLYAFDGVLATITVIGFNLLFLVVLRMGVVGYLLATICSDAFSAVFLFVVAKLWRFVRLSPGLRPVAREMLRYSMPLIPTTIFWWVTNISSRYIITHYLGLDINGLFVAANKLPMMVVLVANLFNDAWQMSAITDANGQERERFFSKVFTALSGILFLCASGVILFDKVIMRIIVSSAFYESWRYVPLSVLATVFSCLVTFLGSVYIVHKRSMLSLLTTMCGAVLNVLLSFVLVPRFGANGAAFSMLLSYFVVFLLRGGTGKRLMPEFQMGAVKIALNTILVLAQAYIMIAELPLWALWEILLFAMVAVLNLRPIVAQLRQILLKRKRA